MKEYKDIKENTVTSKEAESEFSIEGLSDEEVKGNATRRDFLKMLGFSVGYAVLATSCETPVRKAIPFLIKPEEITPGEANYYASTYYDGNDYCSILVKTREGRPIKIEGNTLSSITKGGTSARVQASVLNLYDTTRLKHPMMNEQKASWEEVDQKIVKKLETISGEGREIVLLTSSIISPSTQQIIKDFIEKYPSARCVKYDASSNSAILQANKTSFGKEVIPDYKFENASLIVSFNADFLGNWLSSTEYTKAYSKNRNLVDKPGKMSRHIQFESGMSLTGSNADNRIPVKASDEAVILLNLYNEIAAARGQQTFNVPESPMNIKPFAEELLAHKGESLVVCGSNKLNMQLIVNAINYLLDNYGNTIDINTPLYTKQAIDQDFEDLTAKLNNGNIGAVFIYNCNPAYNYYNSEQFVKGLEKVDLSVSFSDIHDETANHVQFVCPDNNYLESWNDAEPKKGCYSLGQPTIPKLFDTRAAQESLLKWMGKAPDYYAYIQEYWNENIFPLQFEHLSFNSFWNKSLHDGVFNIASEQSEQPAFRESELGINKHSGDGLELILYENIALGNGKFSNNPWLQELPDPLTKATWGNYLCVSPGYAEEQGLKNEDLVRINDGFEIPVLVQPGQAYGTASLALGYGRTSAGKVGNGVGENAFPFIMFKGGTRQNDASFIKITATGSTYPIALAQTHNSMEGRDIVRETTFDKFLHDPASGNELHAENEEKHTTLYQKPNYPNFHWGLAVNLNACIGCSSCAVSCQAENNIAVIGKEEVKKRRIMHWIRIDRYYSEDPENPEVNYQPVMCQQCDNAPCENVCPVAATPHSNEGLNMMAYNRCIGTRYCMNNCPYRVRRFNWFSYINNDKFPYNMDNDLGKMVLNPDVTVRTRGVVEKCSFCSQRIQEKKLLAKKENRQLEDGEIKTACEQSCPADALIFGNLNDPDSKISKAFKNPRNYHLLEQIHTLPSVGYLTKVRNKNSKA